MKIIIFFILLFIGSYLYSGSSELDQKPEPGKVELNYEYNLEVSISNFMKNILELRPEGSIKANNCFLLKEEFDGDLVSYSFTIKNDVIHVKAEIDSKNKYKDFSFISEYLSEIISKISILSIDYFYVY